MALDQLTEQEVQTAMEAISQIIPVLDLQECLKIMQWTTERAATVQVAPTMPTEATPLSLVNSLSNDSVNALANELEEELPPMLNLDLSQLDMSPVDLSIVPPSIEKPNGDNFLVPTLELVGEPPEDLPLAM